MRFARYMESESIPEWRKAYLDYKGLLATLSKVEKQQYNSPSSQSAAPVRHRRPWRSATSQSMSPPARSLSQWLAGKLHRPAVGQNLAGEDMVTTFTDAEGTQHSLVFSSDAERQFFHKLDQEFSRVARFYTEYERVAKQKLVALKTQMQLVAEYGRLLADLSEPSWEEAVADPAWKRWVLYPVRWLRRKRAYGPASSFSMPFKEYQGQRTSYQTARSRLKRALAEYYRSLELLRSYRNVNAAGFRSVLKRFNRIAGWSTAVGIYSNKVNTAYWSASPDLDRLIEETETMYIKEFADGNRDRGLKKLRITQETKEYAGSTWRQGFFVGIALLFFLQCYQMVSDEATWQDIPDLGIHLQIYASIFLLIIFALGFSVNLFIWHKFRINYRLIFELNPRTYLDYHQFAELPSLLLCILAVGMYLDFSGAFSDYVACEDWPLIIAVTLVGIMVCPFRIFYVSARKWFCASIIRIICSPLFPVEFRDFFIADELNSLSYSFWTVSYLFCAYGYSWIDLGSNCHISQMWITPFLAALGPWWRFLQCLRRYYDSRERVHLVNGAKYVSSIAATLATSYRRMYPSAGMDVVWLLASMVNSCYTSIWDIKQDWGLLQHGSRHQFLRDDLVFHPAVYYFAAPLNVVLRFAWALNMAGLMVSSQMLAFATAVLEMYRRLQWNVFRLENEHLHNCSDYHAINEIPLPFSSKVPIPEEQEEGATLDEERRPLYTTPRRAYTIQIGAPYAEGKDNYPKSFYGRRDFEGKRDTKLGASPQRRVSGGNESDTTSSDSDTAEEQ